MKRVDDGLLISSSAAFSNADYHNSNFPNMRSTSPLKSRRKNSHIFQLCYTELCSLYNTPMIFSIKAHLHKRMLDFNGDRVKLDEWRPILKALSLDRSLHLIAVRSKTSCSKVLEHLDSETKSRTVSKLPVLLTSFIFRRLITSLSHCLANNSHLKCLELDGLLLSGDYLELLIVGLEKSTSIQHLSLHRCPLGDVGCQLVCSSLRNLPNILSLDLSGCNITEKGAYAIAKTLQYQNLNRYGENWKQSLRYRTPDTDVMPGLRRVTLNHNPLIGDNGISHIVNVLRDDLWLKALDLQNVGLNSMGGMTLLDLLHENKSLSIVDVRNNPDLDESLFESIMSMLAANNFGKPSEYHWIKEETLYMPRKPSYHSRDAFVYACKPQKTKDMLELNQSRNESNVRLTKSSTIPAARRPHVEIIKAHSTSTFIRPHAKSLNLRTCRKAAPGHPLQLNQLPASTQVFSNKWDHISGDGDTSGSNMRAKLRELASLLEEETQKRLDAEKQKADLELRLKSLTQEQEGQILMDINVVKEITEAFDAFNCFVALFARGGSIHEGGIGSNHLPQYDGVLPQTSQTEFKHAAISKVDEGNPLILSCSSSIIQERIEDSNQGQFTSRGSSESLKIELDVQSEPSLKWKSHDYMKPIIFTESPNPAIRKSPLCHVQKVLNEIIKDPAYQPRDSPNKDSVVFVNNNFPGTTTRNLVCEIGQENVAIKRSSESLYINAEQLEESNASWTTETDWSDDNSPTSTLTELNSGL